MADIPRWYGCYGGGRSELFSRESNRHPAKMLVALCERIFIHGCHRGYWKPGGRVLDPMAGIFTTGIVGAALGYEVLGIELEEHFLLLGQQNIEHARSQGVPDRMTLLQGDSRRLGEVLGDGALCSPLYPSLFREQHTGTEGGEAGLEFERGGSFRGYSGAVSSPPYGESEITGQGHFRSAREPEKPLAKANPHEGYAAVVTSPPYGDAAVPSAVRAEIRNLARAGEWERAIDLCLEMDAGQVEKGNRWAPHSREQWRRRITEALEREEGNYWDRAPQAVITSPPYGDLTVIQGAGVTYNILKVARAEGIEAAVKLYRRTVIDRLKAHGRWSDQNIRRHIEMALATAKDGGYAGIVTSPPCSQIGNLRDPVGDIDAVVTSPPYRDTMSPGQARGEPSGRWIVEEKGIPQSVYGKTKGQIGNCYSDETYLSAMLRVYSELWRVLKPGGVVCLVTKNPVRKGKIRRLDQDTIRLMEHCGFRLIERFQAMLRQEHGQQLRMTEWDESLLLTASELNDAWRTGWLRGRRRKLRGKRRCEVYLEAQRLRDAAADDGQIIVEWKSFFKRLLEAQTHLRVDHEDVMFFRKTGAIP